MKPLLERMAAAVDAHFRADRALVDHPSHETFAEAKRTFAEYRASERREYQSMVADGDWSQDDCDIALRLADDCGAAYEAWLVSVEEDLQHPQIIVEAISQAIQPTLVLQPTPSPVPEKRRDRAFF